MLPTNGFSLKCLWRHFPQQKTRTCHVVCMFLMWLSYVGILSLDLSVWARWWAGRILPSLGTYSLQHASSCPLSSRLMWCTAGGKTMDKEQVGGWSFACDFCFWGIQNMFSFFMEIKTPCWSSAPKITLNLFFYRLSCWPLKPEEKFFKETLIG